MILFKKSFDLEKWIETQRRSNPVVGFVPTMGALHEGHLSLISLSRERADITVCSIFVNPTQFNDAEDFSKYPVNLEADIDLLEGAGCDLLFLPSVGEVYPRGTTTGDHYELGRLENLFEGKFRPGHFQGVCMVVERLLRIVRPTVLFLGQKDYQQCMVIRKLIDSKFTIDPPQLEIAPTLREKSGLAMSSRNMRLSELDRKKAAFIFNTMQALKHAIRPGNIESAKADAVASLQSQGFRVDYVETANANSLETVNDWDGREPLVILVAAYLGDVRLIDNLSIDPLKTT